MYTIGAGLPFAARVALLMTAAVIINVPLGYRRQGATKLYIKLIYIHASIPFIILFRMSLGISMWYIPLSLGSAVAGQLVGGRLRKKKDEAANG